MTSSPKPFPPLSPTDMSPPHTLDDALKWAKDNPPTPEDIEARPVATKFDTKKVRMDLFPAEVLKRLLGMAVHTGKLVLPEAYFLRFNSGGDKSDLEYALLALARELHDGNDEAAVWQLAESVSTILTFGAEKYGAHNWRRGMDWSRLIGAGLRHMSAARSGDQKDPETGKPHLWHFGCCAVFLLAYAMNGNGTDDRYRPETASVDDSSPTPSS